MSVPFVPLGSLRVASQSLIRLDASPEGRSARKHGRGREDQPPDVRRIDGPPPQSTTGTYAASVLAEVLLRGRSLVLPSFGEATPTDRGAAEFARHRGRKSSQHPFLSAFRVRLTRSGVCKHRGCRNWLGPVTAPGRESPRDWRSGPSAVPSDNHRQDLSGCSHQSTNSFWQIPLSWLLSHEDLCFTVHWAAHACRSPVADVHALTQLARPLPAFHLSRRVGPRAVFVCVQSNLGVALLGLGVVADLEAAPFIATHERIQPGPSICAFWPVVPRGRERHGFPPPLIVAGGVGNAVVARVLWARDVVVGTF